MSASVISRIRRAGMMKRNVPAAISNQAIGVGACPATANTAAVGANPMV
jgi:hypothetical protein